MSDLVQVDLTLKSLFDGKHEVADIKMEASSLAFAFDCEKHETYSSHNGFIPYTDFRLKSLPRRYRDHHLLDVIKVIAFLTVRIDVTYTSPARPPAYPCSESRGRTTKRTGTGRIGMVWKYTDDATRADNDHRPCPCSACKQSENPVRNWGLIRVITAVHVVYDKAEALKATCRFGYDSFKSPTVTFEGVDMERADVNDDRCHLSCVTHDLELLDTLKLQWSRYPALHKKVTEKFKNPNNKLVVIVSHPHGCSKHVSLGSWTNKMITGETSTGPGATSPSQDASSLIQDASSPIQGASSPIQGASSPIQGASSPIQGASSPIQGASSLIQCASSPIQGASSPIQGASSPIQGASSPIQGASSPIQGASSPIQGASSPIQGASSPIQGASSPIQGASSPIQGASSPIQGASSPIQGTSSPGQVVPPPVHPFVRYTYTTTTCPGSSGATVYVMGRTWGLWYNQIHSGHKPEVNHNYSGNGCH